VDERGRLYRDASHIDDKKSPQDVDDSSDTHDTIDYLLKHRAQ